MLKEKKMKKGFILRAVSLIGISLLIFASGCLDGVTKEKYERTEALTASIAGNGTLDVETDVGEIKVTGGDITDCNITAKITAGAWTQEEAKELAGKVEIDVQESAKGVTIRVKKPANSKVEVSFDIIVPRTVSLICNSDVGAINITDIKGEIKAATDVGAVKCIDVYGKIDLGSDVGEVIAKYAKDAPAACYATLKTDVGKINFTGPADMSAQIDASTDVGGIDTALPITVTGKVGKELHGSVGEGQGKVHLSTDVGAISISKNEN